jgi:hypothetical protein
MALTPSRVRGTPLCRRGPQAGDGSKSAAFPTANPEKPQACEKRRSALPAPQGREGVKKSCCSGGLRPLDLKTKHFGAHRAPLQRASRELPHFPGSGKTGNDFTGHEVGARRRLAPTANAVHQRRGTDGELWQPRFFDCALRSVKEYNERVEYIHINTARQGRNQTRRAERRPASGRAPLAPTSGAKSPRRPRKIAISGTVTAGLVSHPGDWRWSSYSEYAGMSAEEQDNRRGLIVDRVRMPSDPRVRV